MKISGPENFIDCIQKIIVGVNKYYSANYSDYHIPFSFYDDLRKHATIDWDFHCQVVLLAILWTFLRYVLTHLVFNPWSAYVGMSKANQKKTPECLYRLFFYFSAWSLSFYTTFYSGTYDAFYDQDEIWRDHRFGMEVQHDLRLVYLVQCSFYLHCTYATVFMDHKRKDTLVMLFHHLLTLVLISFSYAIRYHKIGLLVVVLHDVSDVILEFTKINVYLKERRGKFYPIHDHLSTLGFLGFAGTWAYFRLYLYPMKVLYCAAYAPIVSGPFFPQPFYFFFNVMLWILQCLNFYWFGFVVIFLVKVLTGQMSTVEDVRELEDEDDADVGKTDGAKLTKPHLNGLKQE